MVVRCVRFACESSAIKHLMTIPGETVNFVPGILNVSRGGAKGNIEIRGKQN